MRTLSFYVNTSFVSQRVSGFTKAAEDPERKALFGILMYNSIAISRDTLPTEGAFVTPQSRVPAQKVPASTSHTTPDPVGEPPPSSVGARFIAPRVVDGAWQVRQPYLTKAIKQRQKNTAQNERYLLLIFSK